MAADIVGETTHGTGTVWRRPSWTSRLRGRSLLWIVPVTLVVAWVLFFARDTSTGPAVREPGEFVVTLLDALTSAGLYFIVASGFTLIFGLMRTVNMAHGSLFLLAAFIAVEVQQRMVGKTRNIVNDDVDMVSWVVPLLIGAGIAAVVGFLMYEVFLRWNQGQELRQALITLAISVILADQMLARFGGLAQTMVWPASITHFTEILGQRYATTRLFILGLALLVAGALWVWLNRTRMGIVIRAGVADQAMVRALGVNIGVVFAFTFFVGAFLAGMGGVMAASFAGVATAPTGQWLLNSLVVVIIGGLGSVKGAVAGSLLYGTVTTLRAGVPPPRLHVLRRHPDLRTASRSCSPSARSGCSGSRSDGRRRPPNVHQDPARCRRRRPAGRAAAVRLGVLRRLRDDPHAAAGAGGLHHRDAGELREHGVARPVPPGRRGGLHDRQLRGRGRQGPQARTQPVARGRHRPRDHDGRCPAPRRPRQPHHRHLLLDADPHLRRDRLLRVRPGDVDLGVRWHHRREPTRLFSFHPVRLYYAAGLMSVLAYVGFRAMRRTPFGMALEGIRDDPVRMASLGFNVPLHRTLAFGLGGFVAGIAGVLSIWWNGQIDPNSVAVGATLDVLVVAVIGGINHLEGAWLGALVFVIANNDHTSNA